MNEAGIFLDLSAWDYHARKDALSSSEIRDLRDSPGHYQFYRANPKPKTDPMRAGDRVHTALFEPELYAAKYIIELETEPGVRLPKRSDDQKEKWAEFEAGLEEWQDEVSREEFEEGLEIADELREHELVKAILATALFTEGSLFWKDKRTDVLCKARPDIYVAKHKMLLDLKVVNKGNERAFSAAIQEHGYHIQAAHYSEGLRFFDQPVEKASYIVVERKKPRVIQTYTLADAELAAGIEERKALLDLFVECTGSGSWPLYSIGFKEITRPSWVLKN